MIFILGSQRSGTTWLRDCFAHVVAIDLKNEWYFPAFADAVERHVAAFGQQLDAGEKERIARATVRQAWTTLLELACGSSECDKSAYPCLELGQPLRADLYPHAISYTKKFFPDARFVVIVRDPRDVFASLIPFANVPRPTLGGRSTALQFAENWARQNTKWLADRPDAWIRYEDLKSDFRGTLRRAIEAVGVDVSASKLEQAFAHEYDISRTRHRQPAVYRTGMIGGWADVLEAHEITDIETAAGAFMTHCLYPLHAAREGPDGLAAEANPVSETSMFNDVPREGGLVAQPFMVGGWAFDKAAGAGAGIDAVHVWLTPRSAPCAPVFAGVALHGGARPDVAAIFGEQFVNCGYALTVDGLAPGAYDLAIRVRSATAGAFTAAERVPIVIA